MKASADIVIIGGGVVGASAAFHLTRHGAKNVLLLEKGEVGRGQTEKSGGFVQTHWPEVRDARLIQASLEYFRDWSERVGGDCGWVPAGYLHVTGPEQLPEVTRVHEMLVAEEIESTWVEPQALPELFRSIRTDDLVGGAYEPNSGWANGLATTRSLAAAAQRQGATVLEGVSVTEIRHAGGRVQGVETSEGTVAAPVVLSAAGPWTTRLHPKAITPLPIEILRGQVCYMDRPNGRPEETITFYDEVLGLYTHTDGELNLVGIDWDFDPITHPDEYNDQLDLEYAYEARRSLAHRFPELAASRICKGVVGLYDFTPDGHPIVDGSIELEGYYVAAGFSGGGFKTAPMTGLAMAELIVNGDTSVDISHYRRGRF